MKPLIKVIGCLFLFGILLFTISCSSTGRKPSFLIEYLPSKGDYISKTYAFIKDDKFVVSGKIKRNNTGASFGHVDIVIVSPDGEKLKELSTFYRLGTVKGKGSEEATFSIKLPVTPPVGSKVVVGYHTNSYNANRIFSCEQRIISKITRKSAVSSLVVTAPKLKAKVLGKGIVPLEILPSKENLVSKAYAYKKNGAVVVYGKIKRGKTGSPLGHIDVGVISSKGKILKDMSVSYTPKTTKTNASRESSFSINLPYFPPKGSKIIVAYHSDSYEVDKIFKCEKNISSKIPPVVSAALPVLKPKINLVKNGVVSLKLLPSKGNYVSKAYAYSEDGKLVVSGKVKLASTGFSVGHIDIGIIYPDEKDVKNINTFYKSRIFKSKGSREPLFKISIPIIPPTGSEILIGYHLQ